ncbi:MAG: hypothetical protein IAA97_01485, partial [Spirochaetes bacterium]|nr:hypothetical protein [Candidatus Ornithospirochaeta stercoripullorum]
SYVVPAEYYAQQHLNALLALSEAFGEEGIIHQAHVAENLFFLFLRKHLAS